MARDSIPKFVVNMVDQLDQNSHKGGWSKCPYYFLLKELKNHVDALETLIDNRREYGPAEWKRGIDDETADVANFAMMIWDVTRRRNDEPTSGRTDD